MRLPRTTTTRLRMVADQIERHPETWDQGSFDGDGRATVNSRHGHPCKTTACVAGWAVRLTPKDIPLPREWDDFAEAGRVALGLENDLALRLFFGTANVDPLPEMLRTIAAIPEGQRTDAAFRAAWGKS